MKKLILLRGLPGAGKSTFAKFLNPMFWVETDEYFVKYWKGVFHPNLLKEAHNWCQNEVSARMRDILYTELDDEKTIDDVIVVSNTFTQEWEMEPYFNLAKEYGYEVTTLIVENRHGSKSVHGVPERTIEKMRNRFEVKL